jgi:hypothetical protein
MYLLDLVALYITPQQARVAFGYIRLAAFGCGSVVVAAFAAVASTVKTPGPAPAVTHKHQSRIEA